MEGLRGFAVFLVFIVHFATLVKPWIPANDGFLQFLGCLHTIGNAGVDLFFVLSGYLIYGSLLNRPQPFLKFFSRRVERIYPAFTAVFLLYVGLSYVFPAERKIPYDTLDAGIYLLQNYLLLPGLFPIEPMITVAWSLSYEMFYYLAVPFLIMAFGLRERSATSRVAVFSALAFLAAAYCAVNGGLVRLLMFISGILLYEAKASRTATFLGSWTALLSLAGGLLLVLLPVQGYAGETQKTAILFFAFLVLCLVCFNHPTSWLPRLFSCRPLRWLGNMSYSYYLLHGLALKAAFLMLSKVATPGDYSAGLFWMLLPAMFMLTLVPTSILFLLIERPYSLAKEQSHRAVAVAS